MHFLFVQELSAEKDEGTHHIHQTIESGERLYPSTASEGRDIIRQDIRSVRSQCAGLSPLSCSKQVRPTLLLRILLSIDCIILRLIERNMCTLAIIGWIVVFSQKKLINRTGKGNEFS